MSARSVQLIVEDEDGNRLIAQIDPFTEHLVTIDTVHARVHAGEMFQADWVEEGVVNDGPIEILIRVPAGGGAHMAFSGEAGGDARFYIFEGPTITENGEAIVPINRNRRSSNVTTVTAFHTPTLTNDGAQLSNILVAGGSGGNSAGGDNESFAEWILDADQDYLVRLVNISGTAQNLGLEIDFYQAGAAPA